MVYYIAKLYQYVGSQDFFFSFSFFLNHYYYYLFSFFGGSCCLRPALHVPEDLNAQCQCQLTFGMQGCGWWWMKYFVLSFEIVRDDCTVSPKSTNEVVENSNYKSLFVGADSTFITIWQLLCCLIKQNYSNQLFWVSSHSEMKNTAFSRTELYFFSITEGCFFLKYQLTWFVLSEVEEKLPN